MIKLLSTLIDKDRIFEQTVHGYWALCGYGDHGAVDDSDSETIASARPRTLCFYTICHVIGFRLLHEESQHWGIVMIEYHKHILLANCS